MIDLGKKNLLGVLIDAVDYEAATEKITAAAEAGRRCTVTALAVHGVMTGVSDSVHRHRLNQLDLVVPDGQPVRWAINNLHRSRLPDRVYGPNLMLKVCESAASRNLPIFLFGATEEILSLLSKNLLSLFPKLRIAGTRASQFKQLSESENRLLGEQIRNSGARITFAGIGCPRQEVWAFEMGDELRMPILAVGAAFAFHAGQLSQSPRWMQDRGLEWLYRFFCEPTRLWKRYVILNPHYVFLWGMQKMGLRRFDPNDTVEPGSRLMYG